MDLDEKISHRSKDQKFISLGLPNDFTYLLKIDIHKKGTLVKYLYSYIVDKPSLNAIVLKFLAKKNFDNGIEAFLKNPQAGITLEPK